MLSSIEIDQYYLELSKHFVNKNNTIFDSRSPVKCYCIVKNDDRIVALSSYLMSSKSLARFDLSYNQFTLGTELSNVQIEKSKIWSYKLVKNQVGKIISISKNLNIESKKELYKLILDNQKSFLLDIVYRRIDYIRQNNTSGLFYQDLIYKKKYDEAKEILKNNITEDTFMNYPYTSGYAEIMKITLQESAKQIMIQNESENGFLVETENMRIRYTNIIRKETNIENLNLIHQDFLKENEIYCAI
jgi:hypothetical protein